jgi:sulfur-oxidizing protein SoxZ
MSSIKIRIKNVDGMTQVRTLITHPMDNGRHKNELGQIIPAHHILELKVMLNKSHLITTQMGGSISKNPYFDFVLEEVKVGDIITVSWLDNIGLRDTNEYLVR